MGKRVVLVMVSVVALLATMLGSAGAAPASTAAPRAGTIAPPTQDPFYRYTGQTPLADIAPGTVLNTRTVPVHLEGLPLPVQTVQLLYRTTDEVGDPSVTVTSVLRPPGAARSTKLLSYQSFYDSLSPDCQPSYALAGGIDRGGISVLENPLMLGLLTQGYTIATSDFEGQQANFAAGHQYGRATLDGIRAALASPATGLTPTATVGMTGYSGGAIATEWATELAPRYAPDVNRRLVGSAIGGVFANPMRNLHYVDGSLLWAGAIPLAVIGIARSYHIDFSSYLNDHGKQVLAQLQNACFPDGLIRSFGGLKFADLVKPQYANPDSIPLLVDTARKLIMGTGGTPTVPLLVREGTNGALEGTVDNNRPGIGPGDGVMVAGDVRTVMRGYCARGVPIDYAENPLLSHVPTALVDWLPASVPWLQDRFAGKPAPDTCARIAPGNPIP